MIDRTMREDGASHERCRDMRFPARCSGFARHCSVTGETVGSRAT